MSDLRPVAVTPHLFVQDTERALQFYVRAFGAVELFRNVLPDGMVMLSSSPWATAGCSSVRRRPP